MALDVASETKAVDAALAEISTELSEAREVALSGDLPERLFHYTTAMGLKGILDSGRLWATHYRFLNDESEVDYGMFVVKACADSLKAVHHDELTNQFLDIILGSVNPFDGMVDCYIACFCTEDDLLNQWRDYGGGDGGYALGFKTRSIGRRIERIDMREYHKNKENIFVLRKVIYDPERQHALVRQVLELTIKALKKSAANASAEAIVYQIAHCAGFVRQSLADYLISFKHPAFKVEQEWRLCHMANPRDCPHVQFRDGQFGLTPYVTLDPRTGFGVLAGKLPLESITHAPTKNADNVRFALNLLLQGKGYNFVQVTGSVLPIRSR